MRRPLILALLVSALLLAACGDDEQEAASTPTPAAEETAVPQPADVSALVAEISTNLDEKPAVPTPEGDPPAELAAEDVVTGKRKAAKAGDEVSMQYVGVSWSTGQQFDASWDRGEEPFTFPLGGGQVIAGWDEGIVGMKEGGRRVLVIPPEKGYGAAGAPPDIGPNETLIFVVDLEKIAT